LPNALLLLVTTLAQFPPAAAAEKPAPPEFAVPFGCGLRFPVSQAHSVGSHLHNDTYAWDFKMPEGIPIVAAGDGVVRLARGDSAVGGCGPQFAAHANYVVISHPNGLETQYLHFQSVLVKAGAQVKKGDVIGFSGKTGWACGSHLHFKVARPVGAGWNNPSVVAQLAGFGDPEAGTWIDAPACPASPVMQASVETPDDSGKPAAQSQGSKGPNVLLGTATPVP